MLRIIPEIIPALFAGIALAAAEVDWLNYEKPSPVSRRTDLLTMGHNSLVGSPNFKSELKTAETGELQWVVSSDGQKGWAVFRFGWEPVPRPNGIEMDFTSTLAGDLPLEFFGSFQLSNGGFYRTKSIIKSKKFPMTAGRQTLTIPFSKLGIKPEAASEINAIGLTARQPLKITLHRIRLLFDDEKQANQFAGALNAGMRDRQKPMLEALTARGISCRKIAAISDPFRREKAIWQGLELLGQSEQLRYYGKLNARHRRPDDSAGLLKMNHELQLKLAAAPEQFDDRATVRLQLQTDALIDRTLRELPESERRYTYGADTRFYAPTGEPYRMFGPFFFRAMFSADGPNSWRKEDMRYLAALGFNGIRLFLSWKEMEPERGKLNPAALERNRSIIREAERYGLGVSIDLHWPYPGWFNAGQPGVTRTGAHRARSNSYHWSEALVESWRLLGKAFRDCPNIVAFELPTNETPLANDPEGLKAFPELMREWNDFLKRTYGSREALELAWNHAAVTPEKYALRADENWDDATILPMGFQGESSPDEAYRNNPRIQDYLRWAAEKQRTVSGAIIQAIRESIPAAQGMFQRTIGDMWDKSPIPINYHGIMTCADERVIVGTHYNMGGLNAEKAVSLSLGTYDSEQQMENCGPDVAAHVKLGGGFCPFAFHAIGGGGMLFSDNDWHLKPSVTHLVRKADWIRSYWPEPQNTPTVAIITNSRQEATSGGKTGALPALLRKLGYQVKVYESMRAATSPQLLESAAAVITSADYLDPRLLEQLTARYPGRVLLTGRLDLDAYVRTGELGLPGQLVRQHLFLRRPRVAALADSAGAVNLAGTWEFKPAPKRDGAMLPPAADDRKGWLRKPVPGHWGELGMTGSLTYHVGDGWMRRTFTAPKSLEGQHLQLRIGAIDDIDWVWINGRLVGSTGTDVQNYWMAPREYTIPDGVIHFGRENEIVVGIRNLRDDAGIWRGPVEIRGGFALRIEFAGRKSELLPLSNQATALPLTELADGVKVHGTVTLPDQTRCAALIEQGRFWWFAGDTDWTEESAANQQVLKQFLAHLQP